jgi:hypothetical protein
MNFKKATDELIAAITLEDLATALGVSVQAVRQARTAEGSSAHRPAPAGWQTATRNLATRRAKRLKKLSITLST